MPHTISQGKDIRKSSVLKLPATIGMITGWVLFVLCLGIGISIDPRLNLPGRMFAYAVGFSGMTVALACHWALAEDKKSRVMYVLATIAALAILIYHLTKMS